MHIEHFNIYYACGIEREKGWRTVSYFLWLTEFTLWLERIFSTKQQHHKWEEKGAQ